MNNPVRRADLRIHPSISALRRFDSSNTQTLLPLLHPVCILQISFSYSYLTLSLCRSVDQVCESPPFMRL